MAKYSEEFKISVVKKYLDDKIPILELARELEIDRSLILLWIKKSVKLLFSYFCLSSCSTTKFSLYFRFYL